MSELKLQVEFCINQIIEKYKQTFADGKISLQQLFTFTSNATATLIRLVEQFDAIDGPQKKTAVLEALGALYDQVIAPLDIKSIPNFLEGVVDTAAKELLLTLASSWIDSLVNIFNKTGWGGFGSPATTEITVY